MQRQLQSASVAATSAGQLFGDVPLPVLLLTGGTLGAGLLVLLRRTTAGALSSLAATVLAMLYVGLLGSYAVRLRCAWPGASGAAAVIFFILTVKSSDIGAYFVGKFFGRRKLAPLLSPGKTVEGTMGGVVVAVGVAIAALAAWSGLRAWLGPAPLNRPQAIVFAIVMAVGGQFGDLVESAWKRDVGLKDSGRVVPGFGGLLDIMDSPLLTAPVAWWMLTRWVASD